MEFSPKGYVALCALLCMAFLPMRSYAQQDKPNGPGVGIPVAAEILGAPMRLQSGEYSPISGGPISRVQLSALSAQNTTTWTETFCSDIISDPSLDNDIIRHAIGFENFPPGTVINDLNVSIEFDPNHTWMSDVSIGFDANQCGSPGSVAGCSSILFDGDGDDGGPDASLGCNSSDDLGSVIFDDAGIASYTSDCGDDGSINNSMGNLPEGASGSLTMWEGTSPEDMLYWINIADDAGGDGGVLESWCMIMELEAPNPDCSASMTTSDAPVCPIIISNDNLNRGGSVTGGDLQIDFDWELENSGMIDFGFPVDDFIGSTIGAPNDASLVSSGCEVNEFDTTQGNTEEGSCSVVVDNPEVPECGVTELELGGWTAPLLDFAYNLPATYYIGDNAGNPLARAVVGGSDVLSASCSAVGVDIPAVTCPVERLPSCIILPVELSSFESAFENGDLMLRWTTASEQNNAGFDVELKRQGSEFELFGYVEGAGNSLVENSYTYAIEDLQPGKYIARLKQTDFDGTHKYSDEIEAIADVPGKYFLGDVYPNPFNPSATFEFGVPERQNVRVSLHDLSGREIRSLFNGEVEANEIQRAKVDGSDLASGIYIVRIHGNSFAGSKMMILQK